MRPASIVSEAWRNLTTRTTRAGLLGAVLVLLGAALAGWEATTVADIAARGAAFRAAGASVTTLSATGAVDGAACENLTRSVPGIRASGAFRTAPPGSEPVALPRTSIGILQATPGLRTLLGLPVGRLAVPEPLALMLDAPVGTALEFADGPVTVDGVFAYPSDGRAPTLENALLFSDTALGAFDECWVEIWPSDAATEVLVRAVVSSSAPPDVEVRLAQLNPRLGEVFDGEGLFAERLSRVATVLAGVLGIVLGAGGVRLRRIELAAARHVGIGRAALAVQILVETCAWVLPAVTVAALVPAVPLLLGGQPWWEAGRPVVAAGAGAVLGAGVAALLVRDRHLPRHLGNRG